MQVPAVALGCRKIQARIYSLVNSLLTLEFVVICHCWVKRYCPNSPLNWEVSSLQGGLENKFMPIILAQNCKADLRGGGFLPKPCALHGSGENVLAGDSAGTAAEVKLKIQVVTSPQPKQKSLLALKRLREYAVKRQSSGG